jgi:uncharacterized protein
MQKLCPTDGAVLMEMVKNGVTIDVCPECKGVWLDRGELEKLINVALEMEREYGSAPVQPTAPRAPQYAEPARSPYPPARDGYYADPARGDYRSTKDSDEWYEGGDRRYPKKKKSALGRIFDIFD